MQLKTLRTLLRGSMADFMYGSSTGAPDERQLQAAKATKAGSAPSTRKTVGAKVQTFSECKVHTQYCTLLTRQVFAPLKFVVIALPAASVTSTDVDVKCGPRETRT